MIKVEHTKEYSTPIVHETWPSGTKKGIKSYRDILVADVELVLIKVLPDKDGVQPEDVLLDIHLNNPILISKTEKIEKGDWIYDTLTKNLFQVHNTYTDTCVKVLALPEHFSPEQLQDIVDDKLKEGKCLVECIEEIAEGTHYGMSGFDEPPTECFIKLNPHITIYLVEGEKVFTREEVIKLTFDFYFDMSVKMNVPTNLISENRDNAKLWFEQSGL